MSVVDERYESSVGGTDVGPAPQVVDAAPLAKLLLAGLGALLVVAVLVAGSPALDAPWIQGDEFVFIVRNPDVNPAAEGGTDLTLGARLARIATKIHDDLYQPIPVASYALEWALTGGDVTSFRRTDTLLHACNGLLVWWVLTLAIGRAAPHAGGRGVWIAWLLALLWSLHPMFVTTYASDMGRTHLLSALFSLVALGLYLRALPTGGTPRHTGGHIGYALGALAALLLAMVSKPIVGWVLVALVLEATCRGWRSALASWRVWLIGLMCVFFAGLTLWTSRQAGMMDDASVALFGSPLSRSAFAVWMYFRNMIAPLWIAFWYPPDPRTGWGHPLVWTGVVLTAVSLWHGVRAWRRAETRWISLGWVWCWALLLPVIGLVGARVAAAVDRYFYQPMIGVLLVVGVLVVRRLATSPLRVTRSVVAVGMVPALILLILDLPQTRLARNTIRRAVRLVELYPGDPRAQEALAAAYDYARNHPLPQDEQSRLPAGTNQYALFTGREVETLTAAAAVPDLAAYFPGPEDRGLFHRRLSYRLLMAGAAEASLAQAEQARALLPDEFMTWKRLAHAYQAVRRLDDAVAAYDRCEQLLPDNPQTRAAHYTDYGTLLLFDLDRDLDACKRFDLAWETGAAPLPAKVGLALCQIRYGRGDEGFRFVREVLETDPSNVRAGLVLAEYHLRSHHWNEAGMVYAAVLKDLPANYWALRGFHEVCQQIDKPGEAVIAWQDALQKLPDERAFAAYLAWSLALAADPATVPTATALLEREPNSPFGCFAMMMTELRTGNVEGAVEWIRRARTGTPVHRAREFERASASIQLQLGRRQLPAEAVIAVAAIWLIGDFGPAAQKAAIEMLDRFIAERPDSPHAGLVERLKRELSDSRPAP